MKDMMEMIFTKEEMGRITERIKADGGRSLTVDLHGLKVKEAKRLLLNLMALDRDGCDICVIHGYNNGTALKEMVGNDLHSPRLTSRQGVKGNFGRTMLTIRSVA